MNVDKLKLNPSFVFSELESSLMDLWVSDLLAKTGEMYFERYKRASEKTRASAYGKLQNLRSNP